MSHNLFGPTKDRLRVGLLIDSFAQPRWVYRIIEDIKASSIAEVTLIVKNQNGETSKQERRTLAKRVGERRERLLYAIYTKLDDYIFKVEPDAFEQMSIEHLVPDCPVLNVEPLMKKYTDTFPEKDTEAIRGYNLDVALRFGFRILKGEILDVAKYGVWSYHHGDGLINRGGPPGFWEVMRGEPLTGSMLQILNEDLDNGKVIYRSWAPTINKFSVKKNNNNNYWKSSAFVMRKLKELYESGGEGLDNDQYNSVYRPYCKRLYKSPTNSEMLPLLWELIGRSVSRAWEKSAYFQQWVLGYQIKLKADDANNTFYRFKYLIPPKDRFWADPFPVKAGDKYFIFFEEFLYDRSKAHISVIEMDEKGATKEPVKVLEKEYHLSYPFVFEWQGRYYMIPETGANQTVELYRCASFPDRWELEKVLLEANNPIDATLAEVDGRWWMFVNIEEKGVTVNWDELHLFYADSPLGPWQPHRRNPVKSDVRCARPAGRLFYWNDDLYRPAQDCSERYGYATTINKVLRITPDEFFEEEVSKVLPEWDKRIIGTHTLNSAGELSVIDCLMDRRKVF